MLQPKAEIKPDAKLPEWKPGGGGATNPVQRLLNSFAMQAKLTIGQPGDADEQTHQDSTGTALAPDGIVGPLTWGVLDQAAPTPAPPTPTSGCSVTGSFSSIPSGTLSATLSGTKLGAAFNMIGDFTPSIPCNCSGGEYRQYVRGTYTRNGSNVTHNLCGTTLNPTTFQEDCAIFGGTVYKYGYRSIPFDNSKFINPDQATGCTFQGFDHPGIRGSSGDTLAVNLDFKGELIDIWNGNKVLASSAWSVVGTATVP